VKYRKTAPHLVTIFSLLALNTTLSALQPAHAQTKRELISPREQVIYFELPSQPLNQSLVDFALQADLDIILSSKLLKEQRSATVIGSFPPKQALDILLSRSSLTFRIEDDQRTIVIIKDTAQSDTKNLAPRTPPQSTAETSIEEVIVTNLYYPFRYQTISNTQIYGNASVYNSARFINVIPPSFISDEMPNELFDSLKFSSGFSPGEGIADSNDDFYLRGFPRLGVFVDGFRLSSNLGIKQPTANIERVEILKGPSTLFYGQAEPGGMVNIVRKKPRRQAKQQLQIRGGNGDRQQLTFDSTGVLGIWPTTEPQQEASPLSYRLVYDNKVQAGFGDFFDVKREFVAPSLNWRISPATALNLSYEFHDTSHRREQGTVIVTPVGDSTDILSLPQPARQLRPDFSSNFQLSNIDFQHHFSDHWGLRAQYFNSEETRRGVRATRAALFSSSVIVDTEQLEPEEQFILIGFIPILIDQGTSIDSGDGNTLTATIQSLYDEFVKEKARHAKITLDGQFNIGRVSNDLSLGVEFYKNSFRESIFLEERTDIESLSVINENDSSLLTLIDSVLDEDAPLGEISKRQQRLNYNDYGAFLLNTAQLNDNWRISLGGRYTLIKGRHWNNDFALTKLESEERFSPEAGIHYQLTDDVALTLNYSEALKANIQIIDDIGTTFKKPELSKQAELGFKSILFGGRLSSTIAFYHINKENTVNIEFIEGKRTASIGGEQSSTGVDLDLSYQISSQLNLLGTASALNPEIKNGILDGNTPALAAENMAGLFVNYDFNGSWLKGASINLGVNHIGKRFADNENTAELAAYETVEANIGYQFNLNKVRVSASLNIKNLLGEPYVTATEGSIRENRGAGRNIFATLRLTY